MAQLVTLQIADPPALWQELGFEVHDDVSTIDGVGHHLGAEGTGVVGWTLSGVASFDELVTQIDLAPPSSPRSGPPGHPNGVTRLDHVVVSTPNLDRTLAAFEAAGVERRRTRVASPEMTQHFFRFGSVIIEVVGPPDRTDSGPAKVWGLTFVVSDLDASAEFLGPRLRVATAAVQEGRRIAVLDRSAGSSVPMAFMSERPARLT